MQTQIGIGDQSRHFYRADLFLAWNIYMRALYNKQSD